MKKKKMKKKEKNISPADGDLALVNSHVTEILMTSAEKKHLTI